MIYNADASSSPESITMNAHHVETTLTHNGTLTLRDLPFHAGDVVEVIILPRPTKPTPVKEKGKGQRKARERERSGQQTAPFPLRGSLELGCSPKELEEEMRHIRGMWAEAAHRSSIYRRRTLITLL